MSKSIKFLFGCILSILLVYAAARYVTTAIRVEEAELLLRETQERCEALEQSNAALRERIERSGDAGSHRGACAGTAWSCPAG